MRRLCPGCLTRRARLVDPRCPICEGAGVLVLGAAALSFHEPDVVSRAAAIVLEAVARDVDLRLTVSDDRIAPLRDAVALLRAAGILSGPTPTGGRKRPAGGKSSGPAALAASVSPVPVLPIDWILTEAPAYHYGPADRPGARGLPVLSDDGHPSHLARLVDPAEPGRSTAADVAARMAAYRQAATLAAAVPETVQMKTEKQEPSK